MKGTAYLLQATLILLWWLGLAISHDFYLAFQFPGITSVGFNSFFAPDIAIIALLSIIRAYKPSRDLELIILGGFAYGSFYCINASILTGGGYLASTIMILGLFYNVFLVYQGVVFKESKSSNVWVNLMKTIVQIICFWTITLVFFPWVIVQAFGVPLIPDTAHTIVGIILFVLFSTLGIRSAISMVWEGKGTPIPADQSKKLVTKGPYKYVRNPMSIAGLGQGIAVSIYLSSIPVFIYVLVGGIIWQFAVRPLEEINMRERFGPEYDEYRQKVKLWIPKIPTRESGK
jgi:protein-S-isoprenylcysteine O-methyltransferase Ste14